MKSFKEISKKFYLHEKYELLTSQTFDYAFKNFDLFKRTLRNAYLMIHLFNNCFKNIYLYKLAFNIYNFSIFQIG